MPQPALLVLADGHRFHGTSIGVDGTSVGEVVFNTAMTGYQEILTDPSYADQIVTLTYPHIGNTGTNPEDVEAASIYCKGLVVRDVPNRHSNFRSDSSLREYLTENAIVAISDVDTRALTRHLRDAGAQAGCIIAGEAVTDADAAAERALSIAQEFPGLAGSDLAKKVTTSETYTWELPTWSLNENSAPEFKFHVVAMDFGVKHNILRMLVDRGCKVTVVPATTNATDILALKPDGVFLSNGPGDPEPCTYAIECIQALLAEKLPTFGICLGHQLLGLASGASTVKMKFGHHGANHPVLDIATGQVMISSQNHGFAVDADSLNNSLAITHVSLFDNSLQGIRRLDVPAFGFQGHPEASPGPHDLANLFDQFVEQLGQ
ncbi:MAG: glutamine-hydrolyzing carbamoyl-phosphate synthase small subunit [Gammaproteobacteria bacterium]|nr:glutamine-hydrolyzing carbamoyl-phosphate synthase small subunit [Gammaproteobacteria bacterium]